MGTLVQYLLYLRAYISGAIVSRSSLGAEREIDVVTLALQPCCLRAVPRRARMWLAIDISELHATAEKYTYSFLSRSRAASLS